MPRQTACEGALPTIRWTDRVPPFKLTVIQSVSRPASQSSEEIFMATAEELKKKTKVVMFDQYGTVVDMQKG
jgi:hypothetical protein